MITLLPQDAGRMEDLTGFTLDDKYFRIGDKVKLTAPNGDAVVGTLGSFYGVGRVAGIHVETEFFGRISFHWGNGDKLGSYTISKPEPNLEEQLAADLKDMGTGLWKQIAARLIDKGWHK